MSLGSLLTSPPLAASPSRALPTLGASLRPDGVHFALHATNAKACAVRLFDPQGVVLETVPLQSRGEGLFAADVTSAQVGTLYKFVLDDRELPDPYARWLPQGVHGPAVVVDTHPAFQSLRVGRPLKNHVIYELHVGTFTSEGTYAAAMKRLPYLAELGVTTIELMPIAAFDGAHGWGYDGVALFAPHAPYGTPAELREFVEAAHRFGLSVLLDVIYNHFGPSGNYLSAYAPDYFTKEIQNAWGDAPNFANPFVRQLVIDNALYWLNEFHFDGLRLDATHVIADSSPRHILRELAAEVKKAHPHAVLFAEDERNDTVLIDEYGLDGLWADDFHHVVRVTLTGETDGYYAAYPRGTAAIAETINAGWFFRGQIYPTTGKPRGTEAGHLEPQRFVYCIQNHDQIGNRAQGDRLTDIISPEAYAAVSTLLLFLPMTPLLFQGQEWAATTPFQFFTDHDPQLGKLISEGRRREFQHFESIAKATVPVPDPQAPSTFERSKLRWEELVEDRHQGVHFLYRRLLRLRREDPVLDGSSEVKARAVGPVLEVVRRSEAGTRVLLVNFSAEVASVSSCATGGSVVLATCDVTEAMTELPGYGAVILSQG
ncbi:MAG TPA: malto-oligosyltrehalose trehalohydrolase [Polyangia bacterium]